MHRLESLTLGIGLAVALSAQGAPSEGFDLGLSTGRPAWAQQHCARRHCPPAYRQYAMRMGVIDKEKRQRESFPRIEVWPGMGSREVTISGVPYSYCKWSLGKKCEVVATKGKTRRTFTLDAGHHSDEYVTDSIEFISFVGGSESFSLSYRAEKDRIVEITFPAILLTCDAAETWQQCEQRAMQLCPSKSSIRQRYDRPSSFGGQPNIRRVAAECAAFS